MSATSRRNRKKGRKTTAAVKLVLVASCPMCGRGVEDRGPGAIYWCGHCLVQFDGNPEEGGTHHEKDPSRLMTRQEEYEARQRERRARRHPSNLAPR